MKTFFAICFIFIHLAKAHMSIEPTVAPAGEFAKIVFRVSHGCEGSPTSKVTVQIPTGALGVKPYSHQGWVLTLKKEKLKEPAKLHGKDVTERVTEISWSGGHLSDDHVDEFAVILKFPDRAGEKMFFPVIQYCLKGSLQWTQTDKIDKFPAPFVLLEKKASQAGSHKDH